MRLQVSSGAGFVLVRGDDPDRVRLAAALAIKAIHDTLDPPPAEPEPAP
ncbi:MAG: hypothetical protein ACLP50_05800 [Solirubrobacteraceae bacterium]